MARRGGGPGDPKGGLGAHRVGEELTEEEGGVEGVAGSRLVRLVARGRCACGRGEGGRRGAGRLHAFDKDCERSWQLLHRLLRTTAPTSSHSGTHLRCGPMSSHGSGGSSPGPAHGPECFIWRKMLERQRRWWVHDEGGGGAAGSLPLRDEHSRFVPSERNPLPMLNPFDKLWERSHMEAMGVAQPRLLAVVCATRPHTQCTPTTTFAQCTADSARAPCVWHRCASPPS